MQRRSEQRAAFGKNNKKSISIDSNVVYVVDNGSYSIKHGFSGQTASITGNYIAKSKTEKKSFRGDISDSKDKAALFFQRPFDKVLALRNNELKLLSN